MLTAYNIIIYVSEDYRWAFDAAAHVSIGLGCPVHRGFRRDQGQSSRIGQEKFNPGDNADQLSPVMAAS